MAGIAPFFITGASAKIKLNGRTLAFVTELAYTVSVKHAVPHVLGMYEAYTLEPLAYDVNGSFTVIRYAKDAASRTGGKSLPSGINGGGNGIGEWGNEPYGPFTTGGSRRGDQGGNPQQNLNPVTFNTGTFFDIEIYQKQAADMTLVARLRNCRIEQVDFNMAKKTLATEHFAFRATYLDEDSFNANFSGVGQHLA
jgi:hypothetical protein